MKVSYSVSGIETYRIEDGKFYIPSPDNACLMEVSKEKFISEMEGHQKFYHEGDGIYENYKKLIETAKEVSNMRRFICRNSIGLLGGTYAEMVYDENHKTYNVIINGQCMAYKNKNEALRDLKNAEFVEMKEEK